MLQLRFTNRLGAIAMKWQIGEWVACSDSDTIIGGDVRCKLERRAMDALMMLAARAGHVVKKDELIETVWGRLAVSDHSVAMVISQLRRAFRDDARAPKYIETITKRGYRLIAPCEAMNETSASPSAATSHLPTRAPPPQSTLVLVSAGVVLVGVGALSAMLFF
jgi:DNA-binding winged helix-turn-helix (wHTH) protein